MGDNGISHPSCDFFCANMFEQYISPRDGVAFEHHIAPKPSMWQIQSNSGYVTLPPIFYPFNMFGFRLGCLPSKRIQKASLPIQLTLMFYPPTTEKSPLSSSAFLFAHHLFGFLFGENVFTEVPTPRHSNFQSATFKGPARSSLASCWGFWSQTFSIFSRWNHGCFCRKCF